MAWAGRGVVTWVMSHTNADAVPSEPVASRPSRRRLAPIPLVASILALVMLIPAGWLGYRQLHPWTGASDLDLAAHPGALVLYDSDRWPEPTDGTILPAVVDATSDWPISARLDCPVSLIDDPEPLLCVLGDPGGSTTVALAGNSTAVGLGVPLDALGKESGVRIEAYFKQACPLTDRQLAPGDAMNSCDLWNSAVRDLVIASDATAIYTAGTRSGLELENWDQGDYVPESYLAAWSAYIDAGVAVVPVRNSPRFPVDVPSGVAKYGASSPRCEATRTSVLGEDPLLGAFDTELYAPVDLSDAYCREEICQPVVGGVLLYLDSYHLTATYGKTLAPALAEQLVPNPWWP